MVSLTIILIIAAAAYFSSKYTASELSPIPSKITEKLSDLWEVAHMGMRENKFVRAEKALLTILKIDTRNAAAYNRLGILYAKQKEFKDAIDFLNQFGNDFVTDNFKLKNLNKNKFTQGHNIIKTIIINELYTKIDKDEIKTILLASEKETAEYTFIDIVVPREEYIDFNAIENVLSEEDIQNGLSNEIYEILTKVEDMDKIKIVTHDDKILNLINNNILVPIVDDFLLYHKDSEKYDKTPYDPTKAKKRKEDTRIKYITNKIDIVSDMYSKNVKANSDTMKKIEKMFYLPLSDRKAILINNNEEIDVINKLKNHKLPIIKDE
jgi:tetratricopeptide (TPR) repeat protein